MSILTPIDVSVINIMIPSFMNVIFKKLVLSSRKC